MDLPDDMIIEIFSWLPAKAIYKFKSTGKLFSAIASETYFLEKQSLNSSLKNHFCFFLQPNISQRYSVITELHTRPSEKSSYGVPKNFLRSLEKSPAYRIIGSSNGLTLCRSTKQGDGIGLFICNPVTQSWLPIPTPEHVKENPNVDINIAFEYCNLKSHEDSNNFMIFLFEASNEWSSSRYDVRFYSYKESMWKKTEKNFFVGARSINFEMHVYHNKALHFISDCYPSRRKNCPYFRPYIVAYNIEDGESRILRVPKEARRGSHDTTCEMRIFKWGKVTSLDESICLVRLRKSVFTIWVLTDYESNTWRRVLKIRVRAMGMMEGEPISITGFTVLNGDSLVFATMKKVYAYGLKNENYMMLEEICEHRFQYYSVVSFAAYSNSLCSCGNEAASLPLIQQDCH